MSAAPEPLNVGDLPQNRFHAKPPGDECAVLLQSFHDARPDRAKPK